MLNENCAKAWISSRTNAWKNIDLCPMKLEWGRKLLKKRLQLLVFHVTDSIYETIECAQREERVTYTQKQFLVYSLLGAEKLHQTTIPRLS